VGIGGHIVGERKLRRLVAKTGLPLNRAYIVSSHYGQGVVWTETGCRHYSFDPKSGDILEEIHTPTHWTTCDPKERAGL
jgi:hypothetical protein